jgi:type I restriction enzyme S subunit
MNTIIDKIDLWTTAQELKTSNRGRSASNQSLLGIKKLRELIYEIAAKGLLVERDTNNEKICLLSEIVDLVMGQAPPGIECNKDGIGTIFVKTGEFGELIPEIKEWTTKPLKLAKKGDVLICVVGATVGKLNLAIDCAIGRSVAAIRPKKNKLDSKFLYYSLMPFTLKLRNQSRGSAQGVIGKVELNAVEIRLPSLAEQNRIVAKVDELMALCDELENQQTNSNIAHETLVANLLGALTDAENSNSFDESWQRIANHFDILFTTEHSIDQLKKTILQLAVMGKLVPQNPNDEPAVELLKKIAKEKTRLVKESKIKKQYALPEISDDEKPFDLPNSWTWVAWGNLLAYDDGAFKRGPFGSSLKKDMFVDSGYKVYEQYCPINDDCSFERYYITNELYENLKTFAVKANDYLISCSGATLGRITQVPEDFKEGIINQALLRVRINHEYLDRAFFKLLFRSPFFQKMILDNSTGSAIPNVKGVNELKSMPIPFLPLAEQQRIVSKVDELFMLCEGLKDRLVEAQTLQNQLAVSVVEQALN